MKQISTMRQTTDRLRCPSVQGVSRRSVAQGALQTAATSAIANGTTLSMAADRAATALPTVCVHTGFIAEGHWLYTPKFGNFDHFQRWRCVT